MPFYGLGSLLKLSSAPNPPRHPLAFLLGDRPQTRNFTNEAHNNVDAHEGSHLTTTLITNPRAWRLLPFTGHQIPTIGVLN